MDQTYHPWLQHPVPLSQVTALSKGAIVVQVDGSGVAITPGRKGGYIQVPYAGIITGWTVLADQVGDVVIDVWKSSFQGFPPTVADGIIGAGIKPQLSGQIFALGPTPGWTTTIFEEDDIFAFDIESAAVIKQLTLTLEVERT